LIVGNTHAALAVVLEGWSSRWDRDIPFAFGAGNNVAPTAVVEGCLEGNVSVGQGAWIGPGAFVGAGTRIGANAVIESHVRIGRDCEVQPGAVIGCAGFGFYARGAAPGRHAADGEVLLPMPHPAGVVIGDGCWIGANTVIAAGVLTPTTLGRGCKLDSHVQIAHNVRLGDGCLLASQSGLAGSTVAGHRLRLGGAASVDGHLRLGNDVSVAACSGVTKDLPDGSVVAGFPARPIRAWRREQIGKKGGSPD
jgi:UDP-3-O-[3-hydroxymyristoyl] glucosamine N-acyltransferase